MNRVPFSSCKKQNGAVLLVGLMLLVVLVVLGVAGFQSAIIQEKLSGNFRDQSVAFEAAEAGTRWSSAWIQSLGKGALARPFPCSSGCTNTSRVWEQGVYPDSPTPKDALWSTARAYGTNPTNDSNLAVSVPMVHSQPTFIMEQQIFLRDDLAGAPNKGVAFYRISGRGIGERSSSSAIVRAVIAKRFE
ncbi:MAG: hypothetical protein EXR85_05295 [Xanthomonadales bacterium]|nr:hypothetical protein [Xanthomonadales bacterium]